jgi:uncharacterized protein YraI
MSRIASGLAGTALGLFGLTAAALAAVPGYTLPEANLRAGPGRDYPLISLVPPGRPTEIFGCVGGYGWCDVEVDGVRGFISGRKLQVMYRDRRVGLSYYGPRLELPIIQFDVGTYWGQYYQGRPFYAERFRWQHGPVIEHGYPGPHPDYDHGYGQPPHPEPDHGVNDYNHPGLPARPPVDHGYDHAEPAPGPTEHGYDRTNTAPAPSLSGHSYDRSPPPAAPGPADHPSHHEATPADHQSSSSESSHGTPNGNAPGPKPPAGAPASPPPDDHAHHDHTSPAPGQPPQ